MELGVWSAQGLVQSSGGTRAAVAPPLSLSRALSRSLSLSLALFLNLPQSPSLYIGLVIYARVGWFYVRVGWFYARVGWFHARGWAGYICAGGLVLYTRMGRLYSAGTSFTRVGLVQIGKFTDFSPFFFCKVLTKGRGGR